MNSREPQDFVPYPKLRPNQKEIMEHVVKLVGDGGVGMFESPCGTGKTICSLAPALAKGKKVILVTPNYGTRNAMVDEVLKINHAKKKGLVVADLRGKRSMCPNFKPDEFSYQKCTLAKRYEKSCRYYYKVFEKNGKDVLDGATSKLSQITTIMKDSPSEYFTEGMESQSDFFEKFQGLCKNFCGYEMMRLLMKKADVIILDYYWAIGFPFMILQKQLKLKDYVLLIDEADRLPSRLENAMSSTLSLTGLARLEKQLKVVIHKDGKEKEIAKADLDFLKKFQFAVSDFWYISEKDEALKPSKIIRYFESELNQPLENIVFRLAKIRQAITEDDDYERAMALPDLFLEKLEHVTDSMIAYCDSKDVGVLKIKPFEVGNNSLVEDLTLNDIFSEFHSVILYSATMGDFHTLGQLLNLQLAQDKCHKNEIHNDVNLKVIIHLGLSSLYRLRDEMRPKYTRAISIIEENGGGSVLVGTITKLETNKLADSGIRRFSEMAGVEHKGVYAGSIRAKGSRGSNLAKNIKNNFVWGLPLPNYGDFFLKKKVKYLESKYGQENASKLVNMIAVYDTVQWAGRILRKEGSKRCIILGDKRFFIDRQLKKFYWDNLPSLMRDNSVLVISNNELKRELNAFWGKSER